MESVAKSNRPTVVFAAGCVFILVVSAIEVWRSTNTETTVCLDSPLVAATAPPFGAANTAEAGLAVNGLPIKVGLPMQPAPPVATQSISSTAQPGEELAAMANATNTTDWWHAVPPRLELQDDLQREQALLDEMIDGGGEIPKETIEANSLKQSFGSYAPEIQQGIEPDEVPPPIFDEPLLDETPGAELPLDESPYDEPPLDETPAAEIPQEHDEPPAATEPARAERTVAPEPPAAVPIEPHPADAMPVPKMWAHALTLVEQLNHLSPSALIQTWSNRVLAELTHLEKLDTLAAPAATIYLNRLGVLVGQVDRLANQLRDPSEQIALRQAAYSLQRRLDVWTSVHHAAQPEHRGLPQEVYNSVRGKTMSAKILDVRQTLSRFDAANDWEQYLLIDQLEQTAQGQGSFQGVARVELAQLVLERFHDPNLSAEQQAVLATPPLVQLKQELRLWATHPVSHTALLAALEQFEQQSTPATSRELMTYWRDLRWSALPAQNQVAQALDMHYRNANIRFAVSEEMLNRLVPAVREFNSPVQGQILGAQVKGHSSSRLRLLVNLLPDRSRLRFMFEARGVTAARTAATKGPVTLFSRNHSNYRVRKTILMDSSGARLERSQATASGNSNLTGLRTNYDHLPFIGPWVRNRARQRHQEQTGLARRIFVNRVRNEAQEQIDKQIEYELAQARQRLEKKVIEPLRQLDLQPRALEMKTLENRMVLRGRLAANHQLAAHTARPRAHSDNHLSVQIHESALNNFVEQLGLDGREVDLRELYQELAVKLRADEASIPEEIPAEVRIRFADAGAIGVVCDNEAVTLTLRIAELQPTGERAWKDFEVYADYRAQQAAAGGVDFYFSRDGGIRLSRTRRRFALRAIFTKVLSPNRKIHLINPELAADERLADLNVTQLRIRDGWIGLSIGKEAPSSSTARRPTIRR